MKPLPCFLDNRSPGGTLDADQRRRRKEEEEEEDGGGVGRRRKKEGGESRGKESDKGEDGKRKRRRRREAGDRTKEHRPLCFVVLDSPVIIMISDLVCGEYIC